MKPRRIGLAGRVVRFFGELRDAIVQAARSLFAHQLRAALTIAGVAVGIMAVIVIFMVEAGMTTSFKSQLNSLGPNTLYVHKWAWGVGGNDWWKLRNRPVVSQLDYRALVANTTLPVAIAPVANTEATVVRGDKEVAHVDVRGTAEAFLDAGGWQLRRGRFISDLDHRAGLGRLRPRRRPRRRPLQGSRPARAAPQGRPHRALHGGGLAGAQGQRLRPLAGRPPGDAAQLVLAHLRRPARAHHRGRGAGRQGDGDRGRGRQRHARRAPPRPRSGRQLLGQPAGQDPPGLQPDDDGHQPGRHPGGGDHR